MTRKDLESWNIRQQAARHFQSLPVLKNLLLCHECMAYWFLWFYRLVSWQYRNGTEPTKSENDNSVQNFTESLSKVLKVMNKQLQTSSNIFENVKASTNGHRGSHRLHEVFSFSPWSPSDRGQTGNTKLRMSLGKGLDISLISVFFWETKRIKKI